MLESFLDRGGNLLLTGQSLDRAQDAGDFFSDYLGAYHYADSLHGVLVNGIPGDPLGGDLDSLLLLGGRGAQNQRRPSGLEPVGDGVEFLRWAHVADQPAAGIWRLDPQTHAKTVYLGFGLEGVSGQGNTDSRCAVLAPILNWFEVPNAVAPELPATPTMLILNPAYPNPFNGVSAASYQLWMSISRRERTG
jgi:hypothetical protein